MLDKLPTTRHDIFALDELPKHFKLSNAEIEFITTVNYLNLMALKSLVST